MALRVQTHPWYHRRHHTPAGGFRNIWDPPRKVPVLKATLWNNLSDDPEIQQRADDDAITILREECKRNGFNPDKAFPEPPGMDAFRKKIAPTQKQEKDPDKVEIDEGSKGK